MKALLELVKINTVDVITTSGTPCGDYEPELPPPPCEDEFG